MASLHYRQQKIQNIRMKKTRREFVKEIASRRPLTFYKQQWGISRYPISDRIGTLLNSMSYEDRRKGFEMYGKLFDPSISFFDQFAALFKAVPHDRCFQMWAWENTQYADVVWWSSNIYLSNFVVYGCSHVSTSMVVRENCSSIFDSIMVFKNCNAVYGSIGVIESFRVFKSRHIRNCNNIRESQNLQGCQHCIGCSWLENVSYYINNIWYTKEAYEKKAQAYFKKVQHHWRNIPQFEFWKNLWSESVVNSSFVVNSSHVADSKYSYNLKDCWKVIFGWWEYWDKNMIDVCIGWAVQCSDIYAVQWCSESEHVYCCNLVVGDHLYYSFGLQNCSYCFWCIGLKDKSYYILNKQYTKQQRHEKVNIIFESMESEWVFWEFFPVSMNPFYFNETAASLIEDYSKQEVIDEWFLWNDNEVQADIPEWMQLLTCEELNDYEGRRELSSTSDWKSWQINPEILEKGVKDAFGKVYRISPMEYKFLKKHWLPLPRTHWLNRLKQHFKS